MVSAEHGSGLAAQPESATIIADVLRRRYGDDAVAVARMQLANTDGASAAAWQAVIERLDGRLGPKL